MASTFNHIACSVETDFQRDGLFSDWSTSFFDNLTTHQRRRLKSLSIRNHQDFYRPRETISRYICQQDWNFSNLTSLYVQTEDSGSRFMLKNTFDSTDDTHLDFICSRLPRLHTLRYEYAHDDWEMDGSRYCQDFNLSSLLRKPTLKRLWVKACQLCVIPLPSTSFGMSHPHRMRR